jgi:hypothetical protein
LQQAGNITEEILDTLEQTSSIAFTMNKSVIKDAMSTTWWPHILWPAASLIMGSYGLPPSASRNIFLIFLGELVAFSASHFDLVREKVMIALMSLRAATNSSVDEG